MSLSGYGQVSNDEGEGGAAIRERILAGVDRLFHAQGIKSVGVDAIAATLGISKKTLYRHFPSKDDLVIGYLRGRFRPLPEAFTKPPLEQILANLEWIARFLTNARDFRGCAFLNALAEPLTLTRMDPGCAHFSDPPTWCALACLPWASSRWTHSNVAVGWPSVARVIVPCKDWPSATAYGGCGLDKGLSPRPSFATKRSTAGTVGARQRWVR